MKLEVKNLTTGYGDTKIIEKIDLSLRLFLVYGVVVNLRC